VDSATIDLLADLLLDLERAGVQELIPDGDRLRYRPRSALTPDLADRLKTHKPDLLAVLQPAETPGVAVSTPAAGIRAEAAVRPIRWEDCIDPSEPCPNCGGLMFWWNPLGNRRCLTCDPPTAALRMLERAERIRRPLAVPIAAGAAEMLADLRRLVDTCTETKYHVESRHEEETAIQRSTAAGDPGKRQDPLSDQQGNGYRPRQPVAVRQRGRGVVDGEYRQALRLPGAAAECVGLARAAER